MLDADLAVLYEVTTFHLNRAVKRNIAHFPADFMFQLSSAEYRSLRFQIGILKRGAHSKYLPHAFTEQGVAGLSGVLKSKRAAEVHVSIMRAFVRMRQLLSEHRGLAEQLKALEKKFDARFRVVFAEIRKLMDGPEPPRRKIGFGS